MAQEPERKNLLMRARGRAIAKFTAIFAEFRLIEIVVLGVIAGIVLAVTVHAYCGLKPKGLHAVGDELLSALRGTNGTIYAPER